MFSARQSLLRAFDACPLAGVWASQAKNDYHTAEQALGVAFHAIAEELVRTMIRQSMPLIPTEEAMVIADEILARPDIPVLSIRLMRDLRIMVLQFTQHRWDVDRIIALEEPLSATIRCPDGIDRKLTGRPDLLMGDPPGGLIIADYKTGFAKPPEPRDGNWQRDDGRPYLSERGVAQLDMYGLLALRTFPAAEQITLREFHVRRNLLREARLRREDLEKVERYVGTTLMYLDQTLAGIRPVEPRPGAWCKPACPRMSECPVHAEERRVGQIDTIADAQEVARRYVVESAGTTRDAAALKAWIDATGLQVLPVGDAYVGWKEKPTHHAVATVHDHHPCPTCGAPTGALCVRPTSTGWSVTAAPLKNPHKERVALLGMPDLAASGSRSFGVYTSDPTLTIPTGGTTDDDD